MTDCTMDELNSLSKSAEFKEYANKLYDFEKALMSESVMWRFWKSYLDMWELFLCIIYTTRSGDWELYVNQFDQYYHGYLLMIGKIMHGI